jgi:hypothetical protein
VAVGFWCGAALKMSSVHVTGVCLHAFVPVLHPFDVHWGQLGIAISAHCSINFACSGQFFVVGSDSEQFIWLV